MGLIFLAYLLYLPLSGYSGLAFDAVKYWTLTERFFRAGHFELLAYDDSLRGYVLPLLNLPAKVVAHFTGWAPLSLTRVVGAATAALLFGWAAPALWRALFPAALPTLAGRLALAALGFLFWRDYFNFPLSDIPAVLALVVSLRLVLEPGGLLRLLAAGALLAAAVNIRPVYLVAVPGLLLLVLLRPGQGGRLRALALGALLLGFAGVSGPQLLMNGRHHQRWTPLVLSRDVRFPAANLYLAQLGWGVVLQKYETTLDPGFPGPRLLYVDPAGQALLREKAIHYFPDYTTYLQELAHRPLAFAQLYGRHLFNGLDVQYASPYIRQIEARTPALALLHYSVWFGALVVLVPQLRRLRWRELLLLGTLLAPALVTVPMAMECRFLLPLHLVLYAVCCFGLLPHVRAAARWPRRRLLVLAGAYGLFLLACVTLSAGTRAHLTADLRVLQPLAEGQQ